MILIIRGDIAVLLTCMVLMLVMVGVYVALRKVKKTYDPRTSDNVASGGMGLSIEQAEDLLSKGLVSEEEFRSLRDRIMSTSVDDRLPGKVPVEDSIIKSSGSGDHDENNDNDTPEL